MEPEKIIYSYLKSRCLRNTEQALKADLKNIEKYDLSQKSSLDRCEAVYISLITPLSDQFIDDSFYSSFLLYKN